MSDVPDERDAETVALGEDHPERDDDGGGDDLPGVDRESDLARYEPRRPPFRVMTELARFALPVAMLLGLVGILFVHPDGSPTENRVFWSGVAGLLLYQAGFVVAYRQHATEAGIWLSRHRDPWHRASNSFDLVSVVVLDGLFALMALYAAYVA